MADLADEAATRLPPSVIPLVTQGEGAESEESPDNETSLPDDTDPATPATTTEPSSAGEEEDEEIEEDDSSVLRREKLSLGQEYSWRIQQLAEDPTIFNSTIGMFMKGPIDLERLSKALKTVLRRHEIFRTGFAVSDDNSPVQTVFKRSKNKVQVIQVADRAGAEEGCRQLERLKYNVAAGDTLSLVDFHWGKDEHLLVVAYHRLVGDGSTTENLFVEAGQLYNGVAMKRPTIQFPDLAARQREDLESGRMDDDIACWETMHRKTSSSSTSPVLPLMLPLMHDVDAQPQRRKPCSWQQHEAIARLDPMVAFRIKERSRKHKATPMQFYLAAYHVLLARLTGSDDIIIGIADTNRSTLEELSAMGFFANLLPLRFDEFAPHKMFGEHLVATKDSVREAMQHARVPYGVILDRLGFEVPAAGKESTTHAPLFQAVFDYKQGQAESGTIGGANMTEVIAFRERTLYDVVLEMSDDPTKDPLITVKLQSSVYGPQHPQAFLDSYVSILSMFSMNPALKLA